MKKAEFTVADLECVSCERVVERALLKAGATGAEFSGTTVSVTAPDSIAEGKLMSAVSGAGHTISLRKTASGKAEKRTIIYSAILLFVFTLIEFGIFLGLFGAEWLGKRAPWLFILNVSAILPVSTLANLSAYKGKISCMTGMMLGMTAGMQGGLLSGYVLGVTNGFFTGALVSTGFGMLFGHLAGKRGGLMASLQGLMAGFMGGAMGAMTSVMMVGWGFEAFTAFFAIANSAIFALIFPIVSEHVGAGAISEGEIPVGKMAVQFAIVAIFLATVLILGPEGLLGF